ncbi:PTPA-CTERM sorting domain-containing protein [Leptothoe sp. PORK10 BA2]|uniref:PTPA-CTERM sorting domain-containing protein n=1 Tax=Leptothoe sp. PORK10 BA2 TaxID=3110254 RepID=UPI002B1FB6A8|nr:PTPA-CTERM sorting domain-containing protein [Leptothoe sp. PORK10 BA2]MEA5464869.1 PTPA-CTERM sorting domain-containing protein [Leptothoe sp. PORK10 BA2]
MTKNIWLKVALTGALLPSITQLISAAPAQAFSLTKNSSGQVVSIRDLDVGGEAFDVSFARGSFDDLFPVASGSGFVNFLGNPAGAESAAAAIINALGLDSVLAAQSSSITNRSDVFYVPFSRGVPTASVFQFFGDPLGLNSVDENRRGNTARSESLVFAQFSPAAVPTPALLPGLIGMGVAALRKRNLAQSDEA